ncbi:4-hydroxy-tetrahydrodipicolinate reductase [Acetanaerobacterium elongatum]|uniref:4-hydroxy-tetrahydrodipicolinate reductase n=1 Tax=Acetanaerobacterium elongatum TaxID=258515 RepID=A0A1H0BDU4_9FIRM|nr:4-hydroxy-tetrahydrodipicolinate reductase [Acetanaerobacterium elongatum]SDN43593.1 dihydrodipicolinate reductase [Acetanaerobacterium elongatum]
MKKRIILSGCNGYMGRVITASVSGRDDLEIVAGIDISGEQREHYEVVTSPNKVTAEADVIIDFSHPSALTPLLGMAQKRKLPIVVCTTGLSAEQLDELKNASANIPVFNSGNMSLGMNLLINLAKKAAVVLGRDFDIEIIEKHHNRKLDAPSGTALMLAQGINEAVEQPYRYEYNRASKREKRSKTEIGIHSVRGGTIVGEHDVIFAGPDEIVTLSHSARSRDIFATGAINAALFLCKQKPGFYEMSDLLA